MRGGGQHGKRQGTMTRNRNASQQLKEKNSSVQKTKPETGSRRQKEGNKESDVNPVSTNNRASKTRRSTDATLSKNENEVKASSSQQNNKQEITNPPSQEEKRIEGRTRRSSSALQEYVCLTPRRHSRKQSTPKKGNGGEEKTFKNTKEVSDLGRNPRKKVEDENEQTLTKKEKESKNQSAVASREGPSLRERRSKDSSSSDNLSRTPARSSSRNSLQKATQKPEEESVRLSKELSVKNSEEKTDIQNDEVADKNVETKLEKATEQSTINDVIETQKEEADANSNVSNERLPYTDNNSAIKIESDSETSKDKIELSELKDKDMSLDEGQKAESSAIEQGNEPEKNKMVGKSEKDFGDIANSSIKDEVQLQPQTQKKKTDKNSKITKNLDTIVQECKQKIENAALKAEALEKESSVVSDSVSITTTSEETAAKSVPVKTGSENSSGPQVIIKRKGRRGRPPKIAPPNLDATIALTENNGKKNITNRHLSSSNNKNQKKNLNKKDSTDVETNAKSESKNLDLSMKKELKLDDSNLDNSGSKVKSDDNAENASSHGEIKKDFDDKDISGEKDSGFKSEELQTSDNNSKNKSKLDIDVKSNSLDPREAESLSDDAKQKSREIKPDGTESNLGTSDDELNKRTTTFKDQDKVLYSSGHGKPGRQRRGPHRPGISFTVGSRLEARDFQDKWYPAKIIELDLEEKEILIHFERWSSRFDEWVPMNSPRLRAITRTSARKEKKEKLSTNYSTPPSQLPGLGAKTRKPVPEARSRESNRENKGVKRPLPNEISEFPPRPPKILKSEVKKSNLSVKQKKNLHSVKTESRSSSYGFAMKRKKLLVGGIFQAKRPRLDVQNTSNKFRPIKQQSSPGEKVEEKKRRGRPPSSSTLIAEQTPPVEKSIPTKQKVDVEPLLDQSLTPLSSPGSLSVSDDNSFIRKKRSSGGVAPKEFIIEEDHNHFKCPIEGCNKAFRKDSLLASHMKHYHAEPSKADGPSVRKKHESEESKSDIGSVKPVEIEPEEDVKVTETPVKETVTEETVEKENKQEENPVENIEKVTTETSENNVPSKDSKTSLSKDSDPPVPTKTEVISPKEKETPVAKDVKNAIPTRPIGRRRIFRPFRLKTDTEVVRFPGRRSRIPSETPKNINTRKKDEQAKESKASSQNTEEIKPRAIRGKPPPIRRKRNSGIIKKTEIGQDEPVVKEDSKMKKQQKQTEEKEKPEKEIKTEESAAEPVEKPPVSIPRNNKRRRINSAAGAAAKRVAGTPSDCGTTTVEESWRPDSYRDSDDDDGGREEVVNCICRYREEDGLMIQCENCMAWQHGSCFNIEEENKVPEKYICFACRSPKAQRDSFRFWYDQDWWKLGEMSCFNFLPKLEKKQPMPSSMIQCHTLLGNMYAMTKVLHSLHYKLYIAKNADEEELKQWYRPWPTFISGSNSCRLLANFNKIKQEGAKTDEYTFFDHSYSAVNRSMGFESQEQLPPNMKPIISEAAVPNKNTQFLSDISNSDKAEIQKINAIEDISRFSELTVKTEITSDQSYNDDVPTDEKASEMLEVGLQKDPSLIKKETELQDFEEINNCNSESNFDEEQENIDKIRPIIDALLNLIVSQDINANSVTTKEETPEIEESQQPMEVEEVKQEPDIDEPLSAEDSTKMEITNHISEPENAEKEALIAQETLPPKQVESPPKVQTLDPLECQLNLLDHVNYLHEELDRRLDEISQQIEVLEAELDTSTLDTSTDVLADLPAIKKMLKALFSDLNKVHRMAFFQ